MPADEPPTRGEDGRLRCPWAEEHPALRAYHDAEWGLPVHDEAALLERIVLEGAQSGLSWLVVLRKRDAYRRALHGFDPDRVADLTDADLARLATDPGLVRNRAKLAAARTNAAATVALREAGGLDALVWSHRPPQEPAPRTTAAVAATSAAGDALARDLRAHGFRFVGPTTVHALLQACGLVDAHLADCHRRAPVEAARANDRR